MEYEDSFCTAMLFLARTSHTLKLPEHCHGESGMFFYHAAFSLILTASNIPANVLVHVLALWQELFFAKCPLHQKK